MSVLLLSLYSNMFFRAPSLDTINRTYRNIDLAIQQQANDVAQLTSRVSKLKLTTPLKASTRDPRLPDPVSRRPYNVTPHVAVTTAAALNAERSAQKLKRALLAVRKEPLLNTKAAVAPPAPLAFNTPQKASPAAGDFGFNAPLTMPLFSTASPEPAQQIPVPDWTLPEDNFNPSPPPSSRRGAGAGMRKHGSIPLPAKKNSLPGATPSPPAFNWGPLPKFDQAPPKTMVPVEAIKLTPTKPTPSGGGPSPKPATPNWGPLPTFGQTPATSLVEPFRLPSKPIPSGGGPSTGLWGSGTFGKKL